MRHEGAVNHAEPVGSTGREMSPSKMSVLLPARSLLCFTGRAYDGYKHGLDAVTVDAVDASVLNRDTPCAQALISCRDSCDSDQGENTLAAPLPGLARTGERISLTFRRTSCVFRGLKVG